MTDHGNGGAAADVLAETQKDRYGAPCNHGTVRGTFVPNCIKSAGYAIPLGNQKPEQAICVPRPSDAQDPKE
ncbi:MAG: hypothetical protein DHS20C03_20110 [Minwuia thermotolerans]|nr:MAG: hypothetical protein DHS20C03_20110 [Minwuia thermotolerans]